MPKKSGKSQILNQEQKLHVLDVLQDHRYPEKNRAIFGLCFYLGLKAQTIAGLKIRDIAKASCCKSRRFDLRKALNLPKDFVKSRRDELRQAPKYQRRFVSLSLKQFEEIVSRVQKDMLAGLSLNFIDYLPSIKPPTNSIKRSYLLDNNELSKLLIEHLNYLETVYLPTGSGVKRKLSLTDPLFVTQKGGHYSPNTLQDHMGMILKKWAGFDRASSHSGRRSLVKELMENKEESVDSIQKKIGYRSASTIVNYK